MLVRVSVENFRSFDSMVEINMVSSARIQDHSNHSVSFNGADLLKYSAVFGANAAGKSNLVSFFAFFRETIRTGIPEEAEGLYCRNREENKRRESVFEIQFSVGEKFYAYGFSVMLSERRITGEWLYELTEDGNSTRLFSWESGAIPMTGESVALSEEERGRFRVYAGDYEGNTGVLFLSEMNRGKKYPPGSHLLFFQEIYRWFCENLVVIRPDANLTDYACCYDDAYLERMNQVLRTFDTGITEVTLQDIHCKELEDAVPGDVLQGLIRRIDEVMKETGGSETCVTVRYKKSIFHIISRGQAEPKVKTICLRHGGSSYAFRLEDESDGIRRLFNLMDLLVNRKEDAVYIVDDLGRSIHPDLTEYFLRSFETLQENKRVQFLFTTHEPKILDLSLFHRAEIWFMEKNEQDASIVYPLDRFTERYDACVREAYLGGRYGAVPIVLSYNFGGIGDPGSVVCKIVQKKMRIFGSNHSARRLKPWKSHL